MEKSIPAWPSTDRTRSAEGSLASVALSLGLNVELILVQWTRNERPGSAMYVWIEHETKLPSAGLGHLSIGQTEPGKPC